MTGPIQIAAIIIIAACAFLWGAAADQSHMRDEAVRHHAASYYLDANNQRQWKWNDELEAKP